MNRRATAILALAAVFGVLSFSAPVAMHVSAQTPAPPPTKVLAGDLGCYASTITSSADLTTSGELKLGSAITYYACIVTRYVSVIAVFIVIVVGIMYIIGGFKPDVASTAKTIFATTVTGLIFMYLTSFIINLLVVGGILGK